MRFAPQQTRTYFVTSNTVFCKMIFTSANMAELFIRVCDDNRAKKRIEIHEFVLMPDHFHMILTPASDVSLEKAVQFLKGGFSFRAKKEPGYLHEVWHKSFNEHQISDWNDYEKHRQYIFRNPVKRGLVKAAEEYAYSSANPRFKTNPMPEWLRPGLKARRSEAH
jgi:putative transposase